jgi:hypothetical protein
MPSGIATWQVRKKGNWADMINSAEADLSTAQVPSWIHIHTTRQHTMLVCMLNSTPGLLHALHTHSDQGRSTAWLSTIKERERASIKGFLKQTLTIASTAASQGKSQEHKNTRTAWTATAVQHIFTTTANNQEASSSQGGAGQAKQTTRSKTSTSTEILGAEWGIQIIMNKPDGFVHK